MCALCLYSGMLCLPECLSLNGPDENKFLGSSCTRCRVGDSLGFSVISGHKFISAVGVWGLLLLQVPH